MTKVQNHTHVYGADTVVVCSLHSELKDKLNFSQKLVQKIRAHTYIYNIFPPKFTDSLNPRHGTFRNVCLLHRPQAKELYPREGAFLFSSNLIHLGSQVGPRPDSSSVHLAADTDHWPGRREDCWRPNNLCYPPPPTRESCLCSSLWKGVTKTEDKPSFALKALSLWPISICHTMKHSGEDEGIP